jgi:hypothetical protein
MVAAKPLPTIADIARRWARREQRRGPADGWLPRRAAARGTRSEERPHDYNGGASYQF